MPVLPPMPRPRLAIGEYGSPFQGWKNNRPMKSLAWSLSRSSLPLSRPAVEQARLVEDGAAQRGPDQREADLAVRRQKSGQSPFRKDHRRVSLIALERQAGLPLAAANREPGSEA